MPSHRPGPRAAGVSILVLTCALLVSMPALANEARKDDPAHLAITENAPIGDIAAENAIIEAPAEPAYREALSDALSGEMAALNAFVEKQKKLVRPEPGHASADPANIGEVEQLANAEQSSLATIRALHGEDVEISERLGGMQKAVTNEQLLASLGSGFDLDALDNIEVDERSETWRCLTEAMYFEARGEGLAGQIAVGEVILNRVDSRQYPNSVCEVVSQGSGNGTACQFSYHCNGLDRQINDPLSWDQIGRVAALMLAGRPRVLTDDALYFHNTSVRPSWAQKFVRTAKIGQHVFYRPKVRVSMN